MKKLGIYFMMLAMMAVSFVACSDDDDKNPPTIAITSTDGDKIILDATEFTISSFTVAVASEDNLYAVQVSINGVSAAGDTSVVIPNPEGTISTATTFGATYTMANLAAILTGFNAELIQPTSITVFASTTEGKDATASMPIEITNIPPATHPLSAEQDLTWYRLGNTITGLDQFGLFWDGNARDVHAQIKKNGATKMVQLTNDNWTKFTTKEEVAEAIETGTDLTVYKGINVTKATIESGMNVLGVKYNDVYYIIDLTKVKVDVIPAGSETTVTGKYKN